MILRQMPCTFLCGVDAVTAGVDGVYCGVCGVGAVTAEVEGGCVEVAGGGE